MKKTILNLKLKKDIKDKKKIIETKEMYNSLEVIKNDKCLITTYDGIYNDKTDIPKLLKFLNIYDAYYLDILDNRHRLQNGDIGMDDVKVKPKLIN